MSSVCVYIPLKLVWHLINPPQLSPQCSCPRWHERVLRDPGSCLTGESRVMVCLCMMSFVFVDSRLHPLLLVPKAQSQVQAQTSDQQNREPCKMSSHQHQTEQGPQCSSLIHSSSLCLSLQLDGFQRHFDSQIILYGRQVILNLVRSVDSITCITFTLWSQCDMLIFLIHDMTVKGNNTTTMTNNSFMFVCMLVG